MPPADGEGGPVPRDAVNSELTTHDWTFKRKSVALFEGLKNKEFRPANAGKKLLKDDERTLDQLLKLVFRSTPSTSSKPSWKGELKAAMHHEVFKLLCCYTVHEISERDATISSQQGSLREKVGTFNRLQRSLSQKDAALNHLQEFLREKIPVLLAWRSVSDYCDIFLELKGVVHAVQQNFKDVEKDFQAAFLEGETATAQEKAKCCPKYFIELNSRLVEDFLMYVNDGNTEKLIAELKRQIRLAREAAASEAAAREAAARKTTEEAIKERDRQWKAAFRELRFRGEVLFELDNSPVDVPSDLVPVMQGALDGRITAFEEERDETWMKGIEALELRATVDELFNWERVIKGNEDVLGNLQCDINAVPGKTDKDRNLKSSNKSGVKDETLAELKILKGKLEKRQKCVKDGINEGFVKLRKSSKEKITSLQRERDDMEKQKDRIRIEKDSMEKQKNNMEKEKNRTHREKDKLSAELMSSKIKRDTDRFQNLMDDGRPEKVVEIFEPIFNYERLDATDVFEESGLESAESENLCLQIALAARECASESFDELLVTISRMVGAAPRPSAQAYLAQAEEADAESLEVPKDFTFSLRMMLKQYWRETEVKPLMKETVKKLSETPALEESADDDTVKEFLEQCARVAWIMTLQSPPMVYQCPEVGTPYDTKLHKAGSRCKVTDGCRVTAVLWPALVGRNDKATLVKAQVMVE